MVSRSQINIQFFNYKEFNFEKNEEESKNGAFSLFSLRSEPAFDRIVPVVNIGYDGDNKKFGAGLGLDITVLQHTGIIQQVSAIGEYFPTKSESENENSFDFGIRIKTYSHHFDFILSRNSEIGVRRLMSGTIAAEGLRFGFNIKRLL